MMACEYLEDCRKYLSRLNEQQAALTVFPDLTILGRVIEQTARSKNAPELDNLFRQLADYLTRVEIAGD